MNLSMPGLAVLLSTFPGRWPVGLTLPLDQQTLCFGQSLRLGRTLLLGQTRMGEVSRYYQETGTGTPWSTQFLFLLVPALAAAAGWLTYRWWQRPPDVCNTPFGLLGEIASAHGLSAATRRALEQVAEHADLEQPAVLAVSPFAFDQAVAKAEQAHRLKERTRERLGEARRRLFA